MPALVFLLGLAAFIVIAVMRVTDALLPVLASDFGMSIGHVGIAVTGFAIPYGLCQLLYGPAGDVYGKLRVITVTLALSAIFIFLSAFAPGIEALTALRFLSGMLMAATIPLSLAYIADKVDYASRQPTLARYLSGLILGQMLGGGLGGVLSDLIGWRGIFVIFGLATGLIAILLHYSTRQLLEDRTNAAAGPRSMFRPYLAILRDSNARAVLMTVAIEGFFFFGAMSFVGAYLKSRYDLSYTLIGLLLTCFGGGGLIFAARVRQIISLLGERGMVLSGALIMAGCYAAIIFSPAWQLTVPALIALGFGFYTMHNTLQLKATELAPEARGAALALFAFSLFAGQGTGVALLGAAIDRVGYQWPFVGSGIALGVLGIWFQARLVAQAEIPGESSELQA